VYETDKAVQEYLLFHFGKPEEILPYGFGPHGALDFPQRTADLCLAWREKSAVDAGRSGALPLRALDVGCAVGGSAFAFSVKCGAVVGVDFSQAFVNAAEALRKGGELPYTYTVEGGVTAAGVARVPAGARCDRVRFLQGDACALPPAAVLGGPFDIVHAANLLCRLPDPRCVFPGDRKCSAAGWALSRVRSVLSAFPDAAHSLPSFLRWSPPVA